MGSNTVTVLYSTGASTCTLGNRTEAFNIPSFTLKGLHTKMLRKSRLECTQKNIYIKN